MKITYLGTAAAEGFPALFCNCDHCRQARQLGGKNIRSRSQALINDDLLMDLSPDTYYHFLRHGIEGDTISHLLVTHAHSDHFLPSELGFRHGCYAHDPRTPTLNVAGGAGVEAAMHNANEISDTVAFHRAHPFKAFTFGNYTVHPLPARHMPGGDPLIYIIEGEKTLLYAHDTGYFYDEVFEYIEQKGFRFDLVSLDCTNVDVPISDEGHHMGLDNIKRVLERMEQMGAVIDRTVRVINHFSHNGGPLHERLEKLAAEIGCIASYDGMVVEF